MTAQLIPFIFESHEVRITDQCGEPWFILRDLLDAMESKTTTTNALDSIKQGLGEGYSKNIPLQTAGGVQQTIIVSEPAATYLLARSNTEEGRKLNRFIHTEVLPSIRKTGSYALPAAKPKLSREERYRLGVYRDAVKTAELVGLSGNMARLAADNYCKQTLGCSVLEPLGATHLLADERGRTYTPTDLGKMLNPPVSAIRFGLLLEAAGLQTREMGTWLPTDAAQGHFEWLDTGKRHSDGTPVKQIKWFKSVLSFIQPSVQREAA